MLLWRASVAVCMHKKILYVGKYDIVKTSVYDATYFNPRCIHWCKTVERPYH